MMVSSEPMPMIFIERSFCVRCVSSSCPPFWNTLPISPNALLITPRLFTTPMMPAMAMPPMPMLLA